MVSFGALMKIAYFDESVVETRPDDGRDGRARPGRRIVRPIRVKQRNGATAGLIAAESEIPSGRREFLIGGAGGISSKMSKRSARCALGPFGGARGARTRPEFSAQLFENYLRFR